jgi:multidrug transporter EmrE-like cation transporter
VAGRVQLSFSFVEKEGSMSALKIVAILLIVAGIAGLVYGKFTYTKDTHEAQLGPIELSVKEKKTVNVPMWTGVAAIVAGVLLLAVPKKT